MVTEYAYNAFDEVVEVTRAASIIENATFPTDPSDSYQDILGFVAFQYNTKTYYDAGGRVIGTDVEDTSECSGDNVIETTTEYDILGNRTKEIRESYDAASAEVVLATTYYYYDRAGRNIFTVNPDGALRALYRSLL